MKLDETILKMERILKNIKIILMDIDNLGKS